VLSGSDVIRAYFKLVSCASLPVGVPKLNCHSYANNQQYFAAECLR
jgi:hypothetical protein